MDGHAWTAQISGSVISSKSDCLRRVTAPSALAEFSTFPGPSQDPHKDTVAIAREITGRSVHSMPQQGAEIFSKTRIARLRDSRRLVHA